MPDALFPLVVARSALHVTAAAATAGFGPHKRWPNRSLLLDEPLALAESKTSRLRRIYDKAGYNLWDGPAVFREAVHRHGGIQLADEKRIALAHVISMLTWGELAAWTVSAELAEALEDPDARMAASSQVFDEARHFYVLRDYLALLHVPVPRLEPYFAAAIRTLLDTKDLTLKLFAMQILAEGTAQTIFNFLAPVEPVLGDILPFIERDEARHVGLGILHLPQRLATLTARERRALARRVQTIGDLLAATQIRYVRHYRTLGLDPRELMRRADAMMVSLAEKLGRVPETGRYWFTVDDPRDDSYAVKLDFILPSENHALPPLARALRAIVDFGARALPA
jgi:hypothetical protein